MKYKDLLKKRRKPPDSNQSEDDSVSRQEEPGEGDEPSSTVTADDPQKSSLLEYVAGDTEVGESGKENELERLYSKMEKFMGFGHGLLTIDDDTGHHWL